MRGARRIIGLSLLTIAAAVTLHDFLYSPPVIGMLTGLMAWLPGSKIVRSRAGIQASKVVSWAPGKPIPG